jgi:hypothetical protein
VKFHVGHVAYSVVVSDRAIFNSDGDALEGLAIEANRLIIISRNVEPCRRAEVVQHEFLHCWGFHVPPPTNEEDRCQLGAFVAEQFRLELDSQGGEDALRNLPPTRMPRMGTPRPPRVVCQPPEPFGITDRIPCGCCSADIMCGSITNGAPAMQEFTGQWTLERWATCDACGSLQVWGEYCTPNGIPSGRLVSNPAPRLLRGAEASRWLAERPPDAIMAGLASGIS